MTATAITDFADCFTAFEPTADIGLAAWSIENVQTDQGRPFDADAFPHVVAPGGPTDAFDDPAVREIVLQWATRLAKTFFGQCARHYTAAIQPAPMIFVSAREKLAKEIVARDYLMIDKNPALRGQLLPQKLRRQDRIVLSNCVTWLGWARSSATLADKNAKVGHLAELDEWEHLRIAQQGDPEKLADDRFKDYWSSRKVIKEGVPKIKGRSRIERLRLIGTNNRYYVPCPHCQKYQVLRMGDGSKPGGIVWPEGSEPHQARLSACYVFQECEAEIHGEHRPGMMRRGVWLPDGCTIDHDEAAAAADRAAAGDHVWHGWVNAAWAIGGDKVEPTVYSSQLSSLYALALDWGDIAAEFLATKDDPALLRNFVNQWLGETWELIAARQTWESLAMKLIDGDRERGLVPLGFSMLTVGIDKQIDHFVFVVDAWAPTRRRFTLHYGITDDLALIWSDVLNVNYRHADGGPDLPIARGLIDSSFRPAGVYEFCSDCCARGRHLWPCKGSSSALNATYRVSKLSKDTSFPGAPLVLIDTITTQDWMEKTLHKIGRDDPGGYSIFAARPAEHQDFLEQLLNDSPEWDVDERTNSPRERWKRIDSAVPNDYRDCSRYSYAAMILGTRGAAIGERTDPQAKKNPGDKKQKRIAAAGATRRDGRPWV